jgi:hypothetical protein
VASGVPTRNVSHVSAQLIGSRYRSRHLLQRIMNLGAAESYFTRRNAAEGGGAKSGEGAEKLVSSNDPLLTRFVGPRLPLAGAGCPRLDSHASE